MDLYDTEINLLVSFMKVYFYIYIMLVYHMALFCYDPVYILRVLRCKVLAHYITIIGSNMRMLWCWASSICMNLIMVKWKHILSLVICNIFLSEICILEASDMSWKIRHNLCHRILCLVARVSSVFSSLSMLALPRPNPPIWTGCHFSKVFKLKIEIHFACKHTKFNMAG